MHFFWRVICVCKHFGGPEGSPASNAGGLWNRLCPEAIPETPRRVRPGARLGGRRAVRLEGC